MCLLSIVLSQYVSLFKILLWRKWVQNQKTDRHLNDGIDQIFCSVAVHLHTNGNKIKKNGQFTEILSTFLWIVWTFLTQSAAVASKRLFLYHKLNQVWTTLRVKCLLRTHIFLTRIRLDTCARLEVTHFHAKACGCVKMSICVPTFAKDAKNRDWVNLNKTLAFWVKCLLYTRKIVATCPKKTPVLVSYTKLFVQRSVNSKIDRIVYLSTGFGSY